TGSLPTNLTFPTITDPLPPTPSSDPTQGMVFHMGVHPPTGTVNTLATDLSGNIVWYYSQVANNFNHFAVSVVPGGTVLLVNQNQQAPDTLQEIDLAGDTVRQTNTDAVNAELAAMGQPPIIDFDHDAQRLPNGYTAVLGVTQKVIDVNGKPTKYGGD